MSEQTQAASSPAEVEDVFRGETPTLDEFNSYRQSGEIPARFKPAENAASATADDPEETDTEGENPEPEPDPDPEEAQELKPKTAKRIQQLLAEKKELERKLAEKQDAKPESSPAPEPQHTRPEPTPDDKNEDGSLKFDTYEKYVKALARWEVEQERVAWQREQAQQDAHKALKAQIEEARSRYEDIDDVIIPAAKTINEAKIPLAVKEVFAQSDLFIDLCYVVGSDPEELKKFISLAESNPRAAIGKVFEYERGIREELAKPDKEVPEVKKTAAPKPPSPVGGASSRAFDVSDESLSPEEWARKRTSDLNKRRNAS